MNHANTYSIVSIIATAFSCWLSCWMGVHNTHADDAPDDAIKLQIEFNKQIRPILESKCGECHWDSPGVAGLNLEPFKNLDQILKSSKMWNKVVSHVTANEMPPSDSTPISPQEKKLLLSWLDRTFNQLDCTDINPGHVTIKRLNRTEYRNTIRSLTHIDFEPADHFPGDDVGYGFDNIAQVLSLPPVLLEKYLDASKSIVDQAIVDPNFAKLDLTIPGRAFSSNAQARSRDGEKAIFSNGTVSYQFNVPEPGIYRVVVKAYGQQAGDEDVKMTVQLANGPIKRFDVASTFRKPSKHEFEVEFASAGSQPIRISFTNDYYKPRAVGPQDRNLYIVDAKIKGPIRDKPIEIKLDVGSPGKSLDGQLRTARAFLKGFVSRAYRRPVQTAELDRLIELFQIGYHRKLSYHESIKLPIQAALVSPHFLYKVELPTKPDQTRDLHDFELATSLSYFLWSDMPDDQLLSLAFARKLREPDVFRDQIKRMLIDRRSRALVENFASQWLQLRALRHADPDPELFPTVDAELLDDMVRETKLLVDDVFRRDGKVFELLSADFTFLNQRLAEHYGITAGVIGNQFQRISLKKQNRGGGLLTHASILTLTSNPTRTSPVKRGKWVMENLLGEEPPPALPGVMALEDQPNLTGTVREQLKQHRTDPNCASCHKVMDSLGFALENFDAVGRWRDSFNNLPIDASSELPDGTALDGPRGLQTALSGPLRTQFLRCLTEKMLIYALGRGLEYYDQCTIDDIIKKVENQNHRITALIIAIAESDAFRKRRGAVR